MCGLGMTLVMGSSLAMISRAVAEREPPWSFRAIASRRASARALLGRMRSRWTLRAAFLTLALASRVLASREPRFVELSTRRAPSDVAFAARSRDALASRAPSGYDEAEAERFVYLAGAAYCDAGLDTWRCLYCNGTRVSDVTVFTSDKTNVHGYVGWDDDRDRAVVAFRGTEPSSLENWLENLDASHATWEMGASGYRRAFRVHAGFLDSYASVRDDIFEALRNVSAARRLGRPSAPLPVALTGHSLGGALATLAAFELDAEGFRRVGVGDGDGDGGTTALVAGAWTFGSPRVGDDAFAAAYAEALRERTWRITHAHDVVPSVPVRLMGYHHVPTEIFYAKALGDGDGERRERGRRGDAPARVCDGEGEDPTCSDGEWTHTSVVDHLYYLDHYICGCNI